MRDCTAPIGPAVTYIYRSKHITGLGIQGNYQGNLYRYVYLNTPAVEGSAATHRLDQNSEKIEVGSPFVMISANCWEVGT
jgi:hypothetical protein